MVYLPFQAKTSGFLRKTTIFIVLMYYDMKPKGDNMRLFLFFALIATVLTSCGPSQVFTEGSRAVLESQGIDVADIQFYADKGISMRRQVESSETSVRNGEIKQIDGERTQEILIPRGTPGIVKKVAQEKLWVSFEGCEGCELRFKKNSYDSYQIDADKWLEGRGQIEYDGKRFYLVPPYNDALLMVKKNELYKPERRSRVVKGVRIDYEKEKKKKKRIRRKDLRIIDRDLPEESDDELWDDEDSGTINQ